MKKILVIEDEELVRNNILEILDTVDFVAIGAPNGHLGVQLAQQQVPDLILCDVMMPELDGYGVLSAVRNNPATATIPFIFLTAKGEKTDIREGMNQGADDYLTKPFRRKELLGAIEARLAKHAAMYGGYAREKNRLMASLQQVEAQLNTAIHYDGLTQLPNQLLLREQFYQIRDRAAAKNQTIPILVIGLDRFSRINKTVGPGDADRLLQQVAERLLQCLGETDIVARLNADRFGIILGSATPKPTQSDRPLSPENSSLPLAQTLLETIAQPFRLDGHEIFLTASIGISRYPQDGDGIDPLMKNANVAMSHAKQLGGNQYQFYTREIETSQLEDLILEANLRYGLERSEFVVYYQPVVSLETGKIVSAEALVRWQHPEKGLISPGKFIPLAEETGLIMPLGELVLRTACEQVRRWQSAGLPSVRIAVNLSLRQFNLPDFSQNLARIVREIDLDPRWLELELTETILVQNVAETIEKLKKLKALGFSISLDDFGTGYSSLSYLQQFPFDTLKIDRCFVQNIPRNSTNTALTNAIIQMAHCLNLKVIAEGVETEPELAYLCEKNCDKMQGYLFSRPVSAAEFEAMLANGDRMAVIPVQSR
ncbi:EAL domain-containing response regulator [Phormidium sp. CCY1219]|uniref:EAL domain-containing response regulator n=1 Tax=Phormidium sp. CCY1219 TaxID=2886104 RepID=UPI002D1F554F|nr:EAL domain-containing protein [Phormidium sp. CCY1219]MEB3830173.1 EAL domain-containing protein [Phormidium sp. CCY1219]